MTEPAVVGLKPWLPGPLGRSAWWTTPVRAERLAALRIGLAAVLLLDVLGTYWPRAHEFFGPNSLGGAEVFKQPPLLPETGSVFAFLEDPRAVDLAMAVWAVAALSLLVGFCSRFSAAAAWLLAQAFLHLNPYIHNAGDTVRTTILFYLILTPCGAVWSLDSRLRRRGTGAVLIHPWALRLLFVQMATIYFYNGVHKFLGPQWRAGSSLYYVLNDLSLARLPFAELPVPFAVTQALTWIVLAWEVGFPLLVFLPSTRKAALVLGVLFHVGIGLSLELGLFAPYMLCLYLPLVPWECFRAADRPIPARAPDPCVAKQRGMGGARASEVGWGR